MKIGGSRREHFSVANTGQLASAVRITALGLRQSNIDPMRVAIVSQIQWERQHAVTRGEPSLEFSQPA